MVSTGRTARAEQEDTAVRADKQATAVRAGKQATAVRATEPEIRVRAGKAVTEQTAITDREAMTIMGREDQAATAARAQVAKEEVPPDRKQPEERRGFTLAKVIWNAFTPISG